MTVVFVKPRNQFVIPIHFCILFLVVMDWCIGRFKLNTPMIFFDFQKIYHPNYYFQIPRQKIEVSEKLISSLLLVAV